MIEKLLKHNIITIIDEDMCFLFEQYTYFSHFDSKSKKWYVHRKEKGKTKSLHRDILQPNSTQLVDHINGNTLDNRKSNLRLCTKSENNFNVTTNRKNNTSGYKGVSWNKQQNKWKAYIQYNKKNIFLGYFLLASEAAKVYNKAAVKYHGNFANLNKVN